MNVTCLPGVEKGSPGLTVSRDNIRVDTMCHSGRTGASARVTGWWTTLAAMVGGGRSLPSPPPPNNDLKSHKETASESINQASKQASKQTNKQRTTRRVFIIIIINERKRSIN